MPVPGPGQQVRRHVRAAARESAARRRCSSETNRHVQLGRIAARRRAEHLRARRRVDVDDGASRRSR
ncbi:MAG: hypothetical protein MZW92_44865 [Comamonadaceae bacterium]|nr:hypothetical protein [Comamonadaceae bacterium]